MLLSTGVWAAAPDPADLTQSALHILDYVGVDYAAAVSDGRVADQAEFAEQVEFSAQLVTLIRQLPVTPDSDGLIAEAEALGTAIAALAPAADIQARCRRITAELISAYAVNVAPTRPPSLQRGAHLYTELCAACHGQEGRGDGPQGAGLDPKPIDFHDRERQTQRSVYGLFSTITLGVDGTGMTGYAHLADADRWALAFHVSNWFASEDERERGAALAADAPGGAPIADLAQLAQATPEQVRSAHGSDGLAWLAWLRGHPQAVTGVEEDPIDVARRHLADGLEAYRAGDTERAYDRAVAAYLEGFELVEPGLRPTAPDLVLKIERAMLDYRATIRRGDPISAIEGGHQHIELLLAEAQERLGASMLSPGMGFVSSFIILLREGLEAILVLAAVGAFLVKIGRRDALRYLHAGWIGALVLGALTWLAAKFLIQFSGADREVTEGITALFATVMLLWVGCWLHDYAHSEKWREYISRHVQASLSRGALFGLAAISFVAVYREIVETILFYEALWLQAETGAAHQAIAAGMLAGVVALLGLGWGILRASHRLPLRLFFSANTVILFVLAVIFAGKGVAALQEAGRLGITMIAVPTVDILGLYPTAESAGLQAVIIALAIGFLAWRRWQSSAEED